jgi:LEA14-like dessication related protein
MFLSRRRIILVGVIAAIAVVIILLPLILTITLPTDLNKLTIKLSKVEAVPPDITNASQKPQLNVYFDVYNPTQQTLTTSGIDYQLFADGKSLGNGTKSYEDIPLNGRPQLYSNSNVTVKSSFPLTPSNANSSIFKRMLSSPAAVKQIKWRVEGVAQIESGFSTSPKKFSTHL